MEVCVYIIICLNDMVKNIEKCVECCGFEVDQLIFMVLVLCYLVLMDDEKELGVVVLDIGGGIMDIIIYINGVLCYLVVILVVGN